VRRPTLFDAASRSVEPRVDIATWQLHDDGVTVKWRMRERGIWTRAAVTLVVTWALGGAASCGGPVAPATVSLDGSGADAMDADVEGDVDVGDGAAADAEVDDAGAADVEDASERDVADASRTDADAAADDTAVDRAAATDGQSSDVVEASVEASHDLPVEHASATASWTIDPNAACTAAGAGCMDTGTVGGYEVTASGTCGVPTSLQLWFPGGVSPLGAGTYTVKAATGIFDVVSMPAGMVGVLAERDGTTTQRFWGRSGSVTVTSAGASRRATFTGVTAKEETSGVMTTLGADVTCP
jgi:hypothetical protein